MTRRTVRGLPCLGALVLTAAVLSATPVAAAERDAAAVRPLTVAERGKRLDEVRAGLARTVDARQKRLADPKATITTRDLPNAALFLLQAGKDARAAEDLLRRALAAQDTDPASPRYGSFPWAIGDADVRDDNADAFATQALGPILLRYGDKLSAEFRKELAPHLTAALAVLRRREFRKPSYTNIFLMRAVNLILLGEAAGDDKAAAEGYAEIDRWIDCTRTTGVHEYDSPTYYAVDLNSLGVGYLCARRPEGRAKLRAALDYLWADVAANCFNGRLAGPYSRAYDFPRGEGALDLYLYVVGLRQRMRIGSVDLERAFLVESLGDEKGYRPDARTLSLSADRERVVVSRWDEAAGAGRYLYLTRDFALGSTSRDYGPQDRPLSLSLTSMKNLPDVTVLADAFDAPYGKRKTRDRAGHSKPTHLGLRPAAAQHKGSLLALLDLKATEAGETASLATNVLLPAKADVLVLDGQRVPADAPFERAARVNSVVGVREGNAGVAVRVFRAGGCAGGEASVVLKADKDGLASGCARLALYHYAGPARKLDERHVRVGLLILAGRCAGQREFEALLERARSARVEEYEAGETWGAKAQVGDLTLETARDLKRNVPLRRRVNGQEMEFPVLSLNGEDLARRAWKELPNNR